MKTVVDRFLRYIAIDTQSNAEQKHSPSSEGQITLGKMLEAELLAMGLTEVSLDNNGYLMAHLPSNTNKDVPSIGFIAHLDTAPDASGKNVKPQVIKNYQGNKIALGSSGESLCPTQYPKLLQLIGHDLITTDGTSLLGADNKAGIAEIMTAIDYLVSHPEIEHGKLCIAFTPDEEIGRGADLFNVKKFDAQWAYTVDGGPIGELEYENFNACSATVICHGVSVHPGTAKDSLVNSMTIAAKFQLAMPVNETPETTEGYQGFYHLGSMKCSIAKTEMHYILRDFDQLAMKQRKTFMREQVDKLNTNLNKGHVELKITDNYSNMKSMIEPHPHIIELAKQSMLELNIQPDIKPIRGGTDGARLSFMGLPCPNLFTGGYNFHGIHEFASTNTMQQAVSVIVKISENLAKSVSLPKSL
ncbi:peptidase T [Alginatibacterium sediminis]|uniref:Peptidase T n=1 Tax=Alginatibacterium sediminis TaxID=2164068 RepID=A0A420EH67_9ALTE|nr:peptidase T [Alginatibacterium sediminis]RKF20055.1 peptidase T [Alginatibacterium sediminis]